MLPSVICAILTYTSDMLSFHIIKLDIAQSYFVGKVEFHTDAYKINIQCQRRDKVLRIPFPIPNYTTKDKKRMLVRLSGPNGVYVEDWLVYDEKWQSEWLEIDSDEITYYLADHQDEIDTVEILPN